MPGAEHPVVQPAYPGRDVGHLGLLADAWVRQVVTAALSGNAAKGNCAARPLGGPL